VVRVPQPSGGIGATTSCRQTGPTGPVEFCPQAMFLIFGLTCRAAVRVHTDHTLPGIVRSSLWVPLLAQRQTAGAWKAARCCLLRCRLFGFLPPPLPGFGPQLLGGRDWSPTELIFVEDELFRGP
jgi:hypothetical protein